MKKAFLTVAVSLILIALTVTVVILSVKVHRQQREIDDLVLLSASDIGITKIKNVESITLGMTVSPFERKITDTETIKSLLDVFTDATFQKQKRSKLSEKEEMIHNTRYLKIKTANDEFTIGSRYGMIYFKTNEDINFYYCSKLHQFYSEFNRLFDE